MQNIKTPGVYIREVSKLPASVAPVSTAIPAFVGYTEKAERRGEDVSGKPVRITSMLDFTEIFGQAFDEQYGLTLTTQDDETRFEITGTESPYLLHYAMQMFFANGGGPCYVVSAGTYDENPDNDSIDATELTDALEALETEDEPTMIVIPESVKLNANARRALHDQMLLQCSELKDRFAIMDALVLNDDDPFEDAGAFRNEVGMGNLSYGAVYYPSMKTTLGFSFDEKSVEITDNTVAEGLRLADGLTLHELNEGSEDAIGKIVITDHSTIDGDTFTIGSDVLVAGTDFTGASNTNISYATALVDAIEALDRDEYEVTRASDVITLTATAEGPLENPIPILYQSSVEGEVSAVVRSIDHVIDRTLYNKIKKGFDKKRVTLYPSSSMAGIYARVDRDRGVWKAPANVSLTRVSEPSVLVTHEDQMELNVDPNTGKSINAIRKFSGKGTLVWGARTLAGNDNEWRYVPVRRFFIFIEQSIKKATEPVVFEPNDANTWSKVRGMIENFLTNLWRDGAIAGATPADAFFVKVGLGETMSAQDILEGRLIVEIGVAAVRPAEFIILRFMHKLQES